MIPLPLFRLSIIGFCFALLGGSLCKIQPCEQLAQHFKQVTVGLYLHPKCLPKNLHSCASFFYHGFGVFIVESHFPPHFVWGYVRP